MEHSDSNIKKISYIFSKKKLFLYSENKNPEKIIYISGNATLLYFRK